MRRGVIEQMSSRRNRYIALYLDYIQDEHSLLIHVKGQFSETTDNHSPKFGGNLGTRNEYPMSIFKIKKL